MTDFGAARGVCGACGAAAQPAAAFCHNCGAPVVGQQSPDTGQPYAGPSHPGQGYQEPTQAYPGQAYPGQGYPEPTQAHPGQGYQGYQGQAYPGQPGPYAQPDPYATQWSGAAPPGQGWGRPGVPGVPGQAGPSRQQMAAVAALLVVLLGGAGSAIWYFTRGDARNAAADAFNAAMAKVSQRDPEAFCDALYAYGSDLVYESRAECADDNSVFKEFTTELAEQFSAGRVAPEKLQLMNDGTVALRASDISFSKGTPEGLTSDSAAHQYLILRDVPGRGWRIVGELGPASDDRDGYIPEGLVP